MPETRYLFNNTCLDILAVAAEMLDGEVEYRKGDFDAAFAHLRRSVELDDNLPYDEPWGWMQPTRHALGALLLEQGRVEEAEAVYRADLGPGRARSPAAASIRTTSGACTASTSACSASARPARPASSSPARRSRWPAPPSPSRPPATAA